MHAAGAMGPRGRIFLVHLSRGTVWLVRMHGMDGTRSSADQGPPLWRLDWVLLGAAVALASLGWITLRGGAEGNPVLMAAANRQLLWLALAGGIVLVMQFTDYQRVGRMVPLLYVANAALLVAVLVFGARVKGTRGWFDLGPFRFQPAETMKIVTALALAQWLAIRPEGLGRVRDLAPAFALAAVPIGLVLLQPDAGTAMVFGVLLMGMLYWAGVPRRILVGLLLLGLLLGAAAVPFLKTYQRERILVFIDPERDPRGAGYNVLQSKVAVGAGGLWGRGWREGTQSRLGFLPEHHTDFIFASLCEQFGAVGAGVVIGLYVLVGARMLRAIESARDRFGALVVAGLGTLFMFHAVFNIAMTLGMVPVTGIPLPLMSYGGSFMLATGLGLGIVANVHARRFLFAT